MKKNNFKIEQSHLGKMKMSTEDHGFNTIVISGPFLSELLRSSFNPDYYYFNGSQESLNAFRKLCEVFTPNL